MVTFFRNRLRRTKALLIIAVCFVFIPACHVDLLGLVKYSDLIERLNYKNSFIFLSPEDRRPAFGDEFSFIVLTDTHNYNGSDHGLEKRLHDAAARHDAAFVVITGDITQGGSGQDIGKFIEIANSLPIPVYPVIGNHDIYFNNWPNWRDTIGSTCYRIDSRREDGSIAATLFMLDSANAHFGGEQLDWLDRELTTAAGRVFVFTHISIFTNSTVSHAQLIDEGERARLLSILRGRCDFMFMGHAHRGFIREAFGVKFLTLDDFRSNGTLAIVKVTKEGISYVIEKS